MKLILISLLFIIIACAIISTLYYPRIKESYTNSISLPQLLLLVKNILYDMNLLQDFYDYSNETYSLTENSTLPIFFAISPLCSDTGIETNLKCMDLNINNISTENKGITYVKKCTSIDNTIKPSDALGYTLRIKDDIFYVHKNCFVIDYVTLDQVQQQQQPPDINQTIAEKDAILQNGISINYLSDALTLAKVENDYTSEDYGNLYSITIKNKKLATFIVLSRPLCIRIGMSGLYKVFYRDPISRNNSINSYNSNNEAGDLHLKLKRVCNNKIYSMNTLNLSQAFEMLDTGTNVDCYQTSEQQENVANKFYNIMLYYLTHSQHVDNSGQNNTSNIHLYISDINFVNNTETTLFEYEEHRIYSSTSVSEKEIIITNFGSVENITLSVPINSVSISLLLTWSNQRLNCAVFFTVNDVKNVQFVSQSRSMCSFQKESFNNTCKNQRVTVGSNLNTSLISIYDVALLKNLI